MSRRKASSPIENNFSDSSTSTVRSYQKGNETLESKRKRQEKVRKKLMKELKTSKENNGGTLELPQRASSSMRSIISSSMSNFNDRESGLGSSKLLEVFSLCGENKKDRERDFDTISLPESGSRPATALSRKDYMKSKLGSGSVSSALKMDQISLSLTDEDPSLLLYGNPSDIARGLGLEKSNSMKTLNEKIVAVKCRQNLPEKERKKLVISDQINKDISAMKDEAGLTRLGRHRPRSSLGTSRNSELDWSDSVSRISSGSGSGSRSNCGRDRSTDRASFGHSPGSRRYTIDSSGSDHLNSLESLDRLELGQDKYSVGPRAGKTSLIDNMYNGEDRSWDDDNPWQANLKNPRSQSFVGGQSRRDIDYSQSLNFADSIGARDQSSERIPSRDRLRSTERFDEPNYRNSSSPRGRSYDRWSDDNQLNSQTGDLPNQKRISPFSPHGNSSQVQPYRTNRFDVGKSRSRSRCSNDSFSNSLEDDEGDDVSLARYNLSGSGSDSCHSSDIVKAHRPSSSRSMIDNAERAYRSARSWGSGENVADFPIRFRSTSVDRGPDRATSAGRDIVMDTRLDVAEPRGRSQSRFSSRSAAPFRSTSVHVRGSFGRESSREDARTQPERYGRSLSRQTSRENSASRNAMGEFDLNSVQDDDISIDSIINKYLYKP